MTANNNWPDKPGVPMHPERDGWHWLEDTVDGVGTGHIEAAYYAAWAVPIWYRAGNRAPITKPKQWRYLGPVLLPAEAAKREDAKWHEGYAVGVLDVRRGTAFGEPDTHYAALQKRCEEAERERDALRRFAAPTQDASDAIEHAIDVLVESAGTLTAEVERKAEDDAVNGDFYREIDAANARRDF